MIQRLDKVIALLEWQNELLQGLVAAQFEAQSREMEVLEKLLGEGGPSPHEESLSAMERMRTQTLRNAVEEDGGSPS